MRGIAGLNAFIPSAPAADRGRQAQMNPVTINVVSATRTGDYRISLVFDDNKVQEVDFKSFLAHSHHPDIRAFLDQKRFSTFRVEHGDLVWGDFEMCFPVMDLYRNTIEHKETMAAVV